MNKIFLIKNSEMFVLKRNGEKEAVQFDKITKRIENVANNILPILSCVDPVLVAQKVISGVFNGVTTAELDVLSAETAAYMSTIHPEYSDLAARISVSNLQKETPKKFSNCVDLMFNYINPKTGKKGPLVNERLFNVVMKNRDLVDSMIKDERDFLFDYFGFKTLQKSYLKTVNDKTIERPQYMWLRVSLGIHYEDLDSVFETYNLMSQKYFTHATPTLFNSGTPIPQMSSCFLLTMPDDSIEGIFDAAKQCALISKSAGGIGLSIHNIRASNSYISGTNGHSNGLVPMLKVFNDIARYVDQCFTGDSLIFTDSGLKEISELVSGKDKVLTSDGDMNFVNKVVVHNGYVGKIFKIKIRQTVNTDFRITPEHQILILKGSEKRIQFNTFIDKLEKGLFNVEFVDVKDVTTNDYMVFPIPTYEQDIPDMSEEDCRMYGILLGDGWIGTSAAVTLNRKTKLNTMEFVCKYLTDNNIYYGVRDIGNYVQIRFGVSKIKFKRDDLYDDEKTKKMHSKMIHLPKNKIVQILRGLIETDGSVATKGRDLITLYSTSLSIIESSRYLLLRLGSLAGGYVRKNLNKSVSFIRGKQIIHRKPCYELKIPKINEITQFFEKVGKGKVFMYFKHENYIFAKINEITEEDYEGPVYDLEVDKVHDYTVSHLGITHNGGGKRHGSFAIYLEPHHADVFDFLDLKKNTGAEERRARDLFYALWVPNLFMKRVEEDGKWSLMCPDESPGLCDVYGEEFEAMYTRYESEGRVKKTIRARELWSKILDSQVETGLPYILYKDACNCKSNQKNLGTIRSSNLCTEIIQYTSKDEIAVCNLSSVALNMFVTPEKTFDHDALFEIVQVMTKNLNKVIDLNYYPVPEARNSNMKHRPIGMGVQGFADLLILLRIPFESQQAKILNEEIFETIYYSALTASIDLAKIDGPYSSYQGSPASKGVLQFDLWEQKPGTRWNWDDLKTRLQKYGLRNSLLTTIMPVASTASILGNSEATEPYTSNIYTRRTLSGEYVMINRHLFNDLQHIWTPELKNKIIQNKGSVKNIPEIPLSIQELYKTVWEIKQRTIIDLAADRGKYICQSQSMNIHMASLNHANLSSMHFYGFHKGLKTGSYYCRGKPASEAIQFTVEENKDQKKSPPKGEVCTMQEGCVTCSS